MHGTYLPILQVAWLSKRTGVLDVFWGYYHHILMYRIENKDITITIRWFMPPPMLSLLYNLRNAYHLSMKYSMAMPDRRHLIAHGRLLMVLIFYIMFHATLMWVLVLLDLRH